MCSLFMCLQKAWFIIKYKSKSRQHIMTGFRGNESEEKELFFVPRVGCIEECQWHSEGAGLSTRADGHKPNTHE